MNISLRELEVFSEDIRSEIDAGIDNPEYKIVLLYTLDLLYAIKCKVKKVGSYPASNIIHNLKNQDWWYYSFSSNSLYRVQDLQIRLQIKPRKNIRITDMLEMQAMYLYKASRYLIDLLEEE